MRIYLALSLCCGLGTFSSASPLTLPSGIPLTTATVRAAVTYDSAKDVFRYAYTIINAPQSVGQIDSFYIDIATLPGGITLSSDGLINSATGYSGIGVLSLSSEVENTTIPVGFESQPEGWDSGPSAELTAGWYGPLPPGVPISPGQSLGLFVLTSHGLPGVRRFTVEPSYDPDDFIKGNIDDADSDEEAQQIVDLDNAIQRAIQFQGITIGPIRPPSLTDLTQLINFLISLKHQSVSSGWLSGEEFINQLDKKLEQAKKALAEGKGFKARKKLEQFINELEQQRKEQEKRQHEASEKGKEKREEWPEEDKRFLNDNAFFLLKPNAEFIISKLPPKPKDKDEESESGEGDDSGKNSPHSGK